MRADAARLIPPVVGEVWLLAKNGSRALSVNFYNKMFVYLVTIFSKVGNPTS